ncbi:MAG: hypothetical protein AAGG47_01680 [Pseudomonadota bacterium]
MRQAGSFGLSEYLERLSKDGDPLEATVDFEHFQSWLVEGLGYGDGSKGGRPPFDPVFGLALGPVAGWRPHCSRH